MGYTPGSSTTILGTSTSGFLPTSQGGFGTNTASGARDAIGLGSLATQSGTFSGTSSGTNTGDESGTSTPTANTIARFDGTGKLDINGIPNNPTFTGTVTSNIFSGAHIGDGSLLTGVTASVAFPAVTGSATASQLPSVIRFPITVLQSVGDYGQILLSTGTLTSLADRLVFYSQCENPGTSTFLDSSLNNFAVTASGGITGTSTVIDVGASAYFDGVDDKLQIADSSLHDFGTGSFAIAFSIKPIGTNTAQPIIGKSNPDAGTGWDLRYNGTAQEMSIVGFNGWAENLKGSMTINTAHTFKLASNGSTIQMFVDSIQVGTTTQGTISNTANALQIGNFGNFGGVPSFLGYLDSIIVAKGTTDTSTFFTGYNFTYLDPINGNPVFRVQTAGTTTNATYTFCDTTTAVFGLGTNTTITGTMGANYTGYFAGPVKVTALDISSSKKIKENIKTIKIKPDLLDAEGMAKLTYIANSKITWVAANGKNYTTVINELGTGSVIIVDTDRLEADYNNYIELEWAADLNQNSYTKNIQKTYEKGFWQMFDSVTSKSWNPKDKPSVTRRGFVVEDMPDVVKGGDGQSIDSMAMIAYMSVVQQALKADTIFALSSLKELLTTGTVTQQKIDYCNDRLEVMNP